MLQIINVTDARSNLAKLIKKIKKTKKPVVVVQDSVPSVVIYPYEEVAKKEEEKDQLFKLRFKQIFDSGEKVFKKYLKRKNIKIPSTEDEAYSVIKNA